MILGIAAGFVGPWRFASLYRNQSVSKVLRLRFSAL